MEQSYVELEAEGLSREDVDALFANAYGMSLEDYVREALGTVDFNELMAEFNVTGVYYVEQGKLYLGESWDQLDEGTEFTLEGDDLTLVEDVLGTGEGTTTLHRAPQE